MTACALCRLAELRRRVELRVSVADSEPNRALCLCRVVGTATMPTPCSTHKKRTTVDSTQMEQKPERGRPETMFAQGKLTGLVQRSNCN